MFFCTKSIFLAKRTIFVCSISHVYWKLLVWGLIWYIWEPLSAWTGSISWNLVLEYCFFSETTFGFNIWFAFVLPKYCKISQEFSLSKKKLFGIPISVTWMCVLSRLPAPARNINWTGAAAAPRPSQFSRSTLRRAKDIFYFNYLWNIKTNLRSRGQKICQKMSIFRHLLIPIKSAKMHRITILFIKNAQFT